MKTKIMIIVIAILIIMNGMLYNYSKNNVLELLYSPDALSELLDGVYPSNIMIDIRDREDYERGHIDGFINIPSTDGISVDEYLKKERLSHKYVYLMCYSGKRAAKATEYLKKQGYMHVVYITFGYDEYAQSQDGFVPKIGECDCLAD